MFNPMRKYLVLFFNKMNFVCSVLFYWASYLPQWCSIRNTKNNVPFVIFITYIFQNPRSKWLPCPSNYSAGIISFFLSLSYNFKSSKCLSTFMWIFPDMLPLSENSTRQVTSPPFVIISNPHCMILARTYIHAKVFFSVTLISNFFRR